MQCPKSAPFESAAINWPASLCASVNHHVPRKQEDNNWLQEDAGRDSDTSQHSTLSVYNSDGASKMMDVSLQFCDDEENEVYFGDISEKENHKAAKYKHRKTAVFKSGFRKDINVMRHTLNHLRISSEDELDEMKISGEVSNEHDDAGTCNGNNSFLNGDIRSIDDSLASNTCTEDDFASEQRPPCFSEDSLNDSEISFDLPQNIKSNVKKMKDSELDAVCPETEQSVTDSAFVDLTKDSLETSVELLQLQEQESLNGVKFPSEYDNTSLSYTQDSLEQSVSAGEIHVDYLSLENISSTSNACRNSIANMTVDSLDGICSDPKIHTESHNECAGDPVVNLCENEVASCSYQSLDCEDAHKLDSDHESRPIDEHDEEMMFFGPVTPLRSPLQQRSSMNNPPRDTSLEVPDNQNSPEPEEFCLSSISGEQQVPEIPNINQDGAQDASFNSMSPMTGITCEEAGARDRSDRRLTSQHIHVSNDSDNLPDVSIVTFANTTTSEFMDLSLDDTNVDDSNVTENPIKSTHDDSPFSLVPNIDLQTGYCHKGSKLIIPSHRKSSDASQSSLDSGVSSCSNGSYLATPSENCLGQSPTLCPRRSSDIKMPTLPMLNLRAAKDSVIFKEKQFSPTVKVSVLTPPLVQHDQNDSDDQEEPIIKAIRQASIENLSTLGVSGEPCLKSVASPIADAKQNSVKRLNSHSRGPKKVKSAAKASVTPQGSVFERLYAYRKTPQSASQKPDLKNSLRVKLPSPNRFVPGKTIGSPVSKQFTPNGFRKGPKSRPPSSPGKNSASKSFDFPIQKLPASSSRDQKGSANSAGPKKSLQFTKSPTVKGVTSNAVKITTTGSINRRAISEAIVSSASPRARPSPGPRPPIYRRGTPRHPPGDPAHQPARFSRSPTPVPTLSLDVSTDQRDLTLDDSILLQEKKVELEQLRAEKMRLQKRVARQVETMYRSGSPPGQNSASPAKKAPLRQTTADNMPKIRFKDTQTLALNDQELNAITLVNTLCNSQQVAKLVTKAKATHVVRYTQAPKPCSKLRWSEELIFEENTSSPEAPAPTKPARRSIIKLRSADHVFPYLNEPPSPVVVRKGTKKYKGLKFASTEV